VRNLLKAREYGYPDSLAIQRHVRDYYAVITELDGFLGQLFKKIETSGIKNNTNILFMSDNGWMLGDHGFTSKVLPYRPSTHVPFWISGPNIQRQSSKALVSNLDIMPTVLEFAGIPLPENLHGLSLKPIIENEIDELRDYFIYEGMGSYGKSPYNLTLLTRQYRYIVTWNSKSMDSVDYRELYDQINDPLEVNNLLPAENNEIDTHEFDLKISQFKSEVLGK
jgi:arylsulfatase A-like enzyme